MQFAASGKMPFQKIHSPGPEATMQAEKLLSS
jgi:hypothetical protein